MRTTITRKPPDDGETFENPDVIRLFDENDNLTPFRITNVSHTPNPVIVDCNSNGRDDAVDIASGDSQDLNGNGRPDECERRSLNWFFSGPAQGGQVIATFSGLTGACTITVLTLPGQSAETVAANFAAAVNSNACLAAQGVVASVAGRQVSVAGLELVEDDLVITDPGVRHVTIPILGGWGVLLLPALLLTAGILSIRRRSERLKNPKERTPIAPVDTKCNRAAET